MRAACQRSELQWALQAALSRTSRNAGDVEEAQERLANGTMDAATYTAQLVTLQLALEENEQMLEGAAQVCPEFQLNWTGEGSGRKGQW